MKSRLSYLTVPAAGLLLSSTVLSADIKLPGIDITDDRVQVGPLIIDDSGVEIGGGVSIKNSKTDTHEHQQGDNHKLSYINANYSRADFSGMDLSGAFIKESNFSRANFNGANLKGAIIERSNLSRATFIGACLEGAVFVSANFSRANFTDAVMSNTTNQGSNFTRAVMSGVERQSSCGDWDGHSELSDTMDDPIANERETVTDASEIVDALAEGPASAVDLTVHFKHDSAELSEQAFAQIREIASALQSRELIDSAIRIEGHTDSTGDDSYNLDLSYRRALRVEQILAQEFELRASRLDIRGYGENQPIASNSSPAGRALNRRVTLVNMGASDQAAR